MVGSLRAAEKGNIWKTTLPEQNYFPQVQPHVAQKNPCSNISERQGSHLSSFNLFGQN